MEKLIISKELASIIKAKKFHVLASITSIKEYHYIELATLRDEHDFTTVYQVVAYLLGGQDKVYEIKEEVPHSVVWGTGLEEFFVIKTEKLQPQNKAEVLIHHYDSEEEAEEVAKELNDSL